MYIASEKKLGIPKSSRDGFKLLHEANLIDESLAKSLMNMVGFRNIAVHDYQSLELDILESIIHNHLDDFGKFTKIVLAIE